MGYYTHGWKEQPNASSEGKSAREIAEAGGPGYGALLKMPSSSGTAGPGNSTAGRGPGYGEVAYAAGTFVVESLFTLLRGISNNS